MKLQSVLITKVATNKDGGLRLTLDTQELPIEEMSALFAMHTAAVAVEITSPEFLPPIDPEDQRPF